MDGFKIGIIGVGGIGSAHFGCISSGKIRGMSLGGICDIDPERLEHFRKKIPGIPAFTDYREMIKSGGVQAVLISRPHPMHGKIAIEALDAGLHVLTEKPEDIRVSVAMKMNETAKRSGKVFGIMFNQRTDPLYQRAREIVKSGGIGELKRTSWIVTNWYRTQHYYDSGSWRATWSGEGGGVLLNQAPHNLDLWQWICGMPEEITAFCDVGKWHDIEVEDDVTIFARYKNGATGTFITSTGELPGTNRLEITGSMGTVEISRGRLIYKRLKKDEREVRITSKESFPGADLDIDEYVPTDRGTAHAGILQNFADAVLEGRELLAPGVEGINELMISNAAYLSQWTGKTVKIPADWEDFDRRLDELQRGSEVKCGKQGEIHEGYSERWSVRF